MFVFVRSSVQASEGYGGRAKTKQPLDSHGVAVNVAPKSSRRKSRAEGVAVAKRRKSGGIGNAGRGGNAASRDRPTANQATASRRATPTPSARPPRAGATPTGGKFQNNAARNARLFLFKIFSRLRKKSCAPCMTPRTPKIWKNSSRCAAHQRGDSPEKGVFSLFRRIPRAFCLLPF